MTWTYEQDSGMLLQDGREVAVGYAGGGEGKNNPEMQEVRNIGPIPQGIYTIGEPRNTGKHGPYVLDLTPDPDNEMFGRSEFLIHGDSISKPGEASQGCIILPRSVREAIVESGDRQLVVIKGDENVG